MSNVLNEKMKYYQSGDYWLLKNNLTKSPSMCFFTLQKFPKFPLRKDINTERLLTKSTKKISTFASLTSRSLSMKNIEFYSLPKIINKPMINKSKKKEPIMHPEKKNMFKIFSNLSIRDSLCKKKLKISQVTLELNK
jgi:hypothetical protein